MANVTNSVVHYILQRVSLTLPDAHQLPPSSSPLLTIAALKHSSPQSFYRLPAFTLLLNLVKSQMEMTYELVMSLQSGIIDGDLPASNLDEWEELSGKVSDSLEFLQQVVSVSQLHLVLDMQASFHGSTGDL